MDIKDFDYNLPQDRIAQHPLKDRASSRLMVLHRSTDRVEHRVFRDIINFLERNDALVLNDTKVIPARLLGRKKTGGAIELLLVRQSGSVNAWLCMMKNSKGMRPGARIFFDKGVEASVIGKTDDGLWECSFKSLPGREDFYAEVGLVPLPPYIKRPPVENDAARYQTEFAKRPGAAAAPTAGLHFTTKLLEELAAKGVSVEFITLHVGPGTFLPVKTQDVELHKMHEEFYNIPPEAFASIIETKKRGGRVFAVGSTALRALETSVRRGLENPALTGYTDLFIYPAGPTGPAGLGFDFKLTDALITNFHLPRSTLLMLVCAFAGRHKILDAYAEAVKEGYRFFSYGDAMLII